MRKVTDPIHPSSQRSGGAKREPGRAKPQLKFGRHFRPSDHPPLLILVAFLAVGVVSSTAAQGPSYDLVIRNGRIVDGSGSPWYRSDVAIRGDTIVRVAPSIADATTRVSALRVGRVPFGKESGRHHAHAGDGRHAW